MPLSKSLRIIDVTALWLSQCRRADRDRVDAEAHQTVTCHQTPKRVPLDMCSSCLHDFAPGDQAVSRMRGKHRTKIYCIRCAIRLHVIDANDIMNKR